MTIMEPGVTDWKYMPARILRWLTMRIGTVALSPDLNWMRMKSPRRIPARMNSTMIRAFALCGMVSFGISRVVIYICTKYIFESLRLPRYAKEEESLSNTYQWYSDPPHCSARRRQTIPGKKKSVPKGSSFRIC